MPLICAFDSNGGNYKGILQTGQMREGKVQNLYGADQSQRLGWIQDIVENHWVIYNKTRAIKMQTNEQDRTDQGFSLFLLHFHRQNYDITCSQ